MEQTNKKPILVIEEVTKQFPKMQKPALNSVSACVYPGEITGLIGPDGAGKTTLIRVIIGLLTQDRGKVIVYPGLRDTQYDSLQDTIAIQKITGYMPQKFGLYENLTVIENLHLYGELRDLKENERLEKFDHLLSLTELKQFETRMVKNLSGGMKQKLAIACATIGNPKLVLLDEPGVGVDPISRNAIWRLAESLVSKGAAVLWSTSYLDEAERCANVILLNEGVKVYAGPPAALFERVTDRVFDIRGLETINKRSLLINTLKKECVIDSVVQNDGVHLVLSKDATSDSINIGTLQKSKPRFEDAFMDILGGVQCRSSRLAEQLYKKSLDHKPIIEAKGLMKRFGDFIAVRDNTFTVHQGQIFGLLGPNGAGKSTTFKMMCGLLQPSQGEAYIKGISLKNFTSEARGQIGYMAQNFSLYGNLSVMQNLKLFSGLYGLQGKKQKAQIEMMVEIFGLSPYLDHNACEIPLGFKQRLALSCALMHEPDALFLDEPTSGVDPIARREFWLHINAMVEKGLTIMVTTHFIEEAEYCDRVSLIYGGKSIATGTPEELKKLASHKKDSLCTLEDAFIQLITDSQREAM
ncbi:ABC transporter ATP-binding protein [Rickettsiales endosymbiont of Peranema trichophorum]|uniref:ATP-binding cassette domain-containing protein n=1 Tax=Rickettsiales endosymbiont of Peranema trichophorum TaxID=2486577 RepID=UPI001022FEDF|nr:ATP-binding cassette domain-containing protein [Rickettsiales endosymbiont of Peranema trichophorum]RZI47345.1 ABC transporter ATP-binding protein [Rickettsiales endosymbiont of Peranema trichophorum]